MLVSFAAKALSAALSLLLSTLLVSNYLYREVRIRPMEAEQTRLQQFVPTSMLYLLEREGKAVGIHQISAAPHDSSGRRWIHVEETAELRIPVPGGDEQHARQESFQLLDDNLRLVDWRFVVRAGAPGEAIQTTEITGRRIPMLSDSMRIAIHTGGASRTFTMRVGPDAVQGSGAWVRLLLSGRLREGERVRLREMDPTNLALRPLEIEVGPQRHVPGDSARAQDDELYDAGTEGRMRIFPVRQTAGGMVYQLWVAENGLPVRANLPMGVIARPAAAHEAVALAERWASGVPQGPDEGDGGVQSLIAESAIAAGAEISGARDLSTMRILVSGVTLPEGASGGVQYVRGDTVEVRHSPFPPRGRTGYQLPAENEESPLLGHVELRASLLAEPFIESDHPEVIAAARAALGGTRDPSVAARRISDFVHAHLEKRYTASLPSAIEALRGASGDCNEHTMLTVAMLRAVGIPARPVSGLAYLDGSFYFHAWVEAWFPGRWVPIDPTFGAAPADPARLRLFVGREKINAVLPLVGTLNLEVLETKP